MQVQSLGQEDPLEEEIATRSSILAWKIPWAKESGGLSLWGCKELDMTWQLNSNIHHIYFYSCSERQYLGLFRNKQNTLERKAVTALESNQKQAETKGDFDLSKKEPHRMRPMFRQFSDEGTPQPARQKAALLTVWRVRGQSSELSEWLKIRELDPERS